MNRNFFLLPAVLLIILLLTISCRPGAPSLPTFTPSPELELSYEEEGEPFIGLPNPASFYCEEMGYTLEMRETDQGTQGICVLPDGQECDEWDFLAGRCGKNQSFCERQGYTLEPGDNIGTCVFPDGSTCPEYEFFIQECLPPEQ